MVRFAGRLGGDTLDEYQAFVRLVDVLDVYNVDLLMPLYFLRKRDCKYILIGQLYAINLVATNVVFQCGVRRKRRVVGGIGQLVVSGEGGDQGRTEIDELEVELSCWILV